MPGPGSFLAPSVSLCPRRGLSTNPPRWFLAHLPSTSPEQSRREQQRRGRRERCQPPRPHLPRPRKQLPKLRPCSAAWERPQGCRAEREPGLGGQEGAWHRVPPWECPRGTEPSEKAWSSPSGRDPTGVSVFQKPGHGPVVASLPCCQATLSLGVPWLSVGSGRHL